MGLKESEGPFRTYLKVVVPSREELRAAAGPILLCALLYGGLYCSVGDTFLPPSGACWSVVLIWAAAHVGGVLLHRVVPQLPPLLGMLAAGIFLRNVPSDLVRGLPYSWTKEIRYGCLAVDLLMSGMEQDLEVFKRVGWAPVRLLIFPGIVEALVAGAVGHAVFGMPILLALAMGFILTPVDHSISTFLMCGYQDENRGVAKGIPSIVVAAATFDDIVALAFYTIFISRAVVERDGILAYSIPSGPLNVAFGLVLGALGALVCSATKLWDSSAKRTLVVLLIALLQMYFMVEFQFFAAGILSAIVLGVGTSTAWEKGWPRILSSGPSEVHGAVVEHHVAWVWAWVAQPLLFGLVGTAVDFRKIKARTVPLSFAVIFAGWVARMPTAALSVSGAGLSAREKAFVMLAWLPKATVQAGLAAMPLDIIMDEGKGQDYVEWGDDILVTALFSIIVCAPLGIIAVSAFGRMLLSKDKEDSTLHEDLEAAKVDALEKVPSFPVARKLPSRAISMPVMLPSVVHNGGGHTALQLQAVKHFFGHAPGGVAKQLEGNLSPFSVAPTEGNFQCQQRHVGNRREDARVDVPLDDLLAGPNTDVQRSLTAIDREARLLEVQQVVGVAASQAAAQRLHAAVRQLRHACGTADGSGLLRRDGARSFLRRSSTLARASMPAAAGECAEEQHAVERL